MIDRETVQRIKDAADIVEVVGDYVNLTRRGANYMGLCPFHNERTPSFSVSPKRNFCHCFSCHKGGSPVNFIMEKEGISYHDALLWLAKKYNITVHEKELTDEERARITERESMMVASEWAMRHFHDNLFNTEEGRDVGLSYFYSRGITDEAIRKYMLGYSIDRGNALLTAARNEGFDIDILKKIGLIGTSQEGRDYDKFRGRVMFPIRNTSGKPVAFGGRTLKGEAAKYINSPETLLYKKSNELYGIFEAKNDIVNSGRVFLMEGYLDVNSSWQSGVKNIVASSGTALTDGQIALLHRFTDNVTLVYDGDPAGIKASLRGIDMLLSHKLHVNVLLLPDGEDPDSLSKKLTPQEFQKFIADNQTDFIEFKSKVLMKDAGSNLQARNEAIMSVVQSIACIPNEVERSLYIQKCSTLMEVNEAAVASAVARQRKLVYKKQTAEKTRKENYTPTGEEAGLQTARTPDVKSPQAEKENPLYPIEREIIKYCIRYGYAPIENAPTEEEATDETPLLVIEYITDELEADGLSFSHPPFRKLFELLSRELNEFNRDLEKFNRDIAESLEREKSGFRDNLMAQGLSFAEMEKAEQKIEKEIREKRLTEMRNFSLNYSGNMLMDHEDDEIRGIVNTLIQEPHQLSAIYSRDGMKVKLEEDKLDELVPRAVSELRSEIIGLRVKELNERISRSAGSVSPEELQAMLHELQKLLTVRSKLAENLGDRILYPR